MVIIVFPALIALIGVLMWALSKNGEVKEIGRIMFFTGLLAFMLRLGPEAVAIFK